MRNDSVAIVESFWREVWSHPQNPDAVDRLVHENFILTTGGNDVTSRDAFKKWVVAFQAKINDFEFHVEETFQNEDGSRVASRWRVTGRNNGYLGLEADGEPISMTGIAIWEVGRDGLLHHNWVERNAWEVHSAIMLSSNTSRRTT